MRHMQRDNGQQPPAPEGWFAPGLILPWGGAGGGDIGGDAIVTAKTLRYEVEEITPEGDC